jgi:5'-nucleotidase
MTAANRTPMRALITNDDGVGSEGIRTLAAVAFDAGLEVTVAAPDQERSGSSAALSALEDDGRLLVEERPIKLPTKSTDDRSLSAFAVHASPAMIVFAATEGAFGPPPDLVLSGINHGPNTGQAVLHSGTVGAALTAAAHGLPSMAISLATTAAPTAARNWATATAAAAHALAWFITHTADAYTLNINIPDIALEQLRGLRTSELAPFGAVQARVGQRGADYVTITLSENNAKASPGTDVALLHERWATATVLCPPRAERLVDLTGLERQFR